MELNEMEKSLIFQTESYGKSDVTYELRMCLPYIPDPVKRKTAEELMRKLDAMPEKDCLALIQDIRKAFSLPWARRCATSAVSYLQRRGISPDVISRCFRDGLFYEARHHGEPVCVFVGKDEAGKAKFACMRSIAGSLRKDVYGSDKEYSFCYPPRNPDSRHVAVFEAPIDALSHATLQELKGWKWDGYRLSLGGTSHVALTAFLKRHPEIRRVSLYMDNDLGGLKNARRIRAMLHEDQRFRHIRVGVNPPRMGKDYNEMLLHVVEQMKGHQQQCRQKQAAISI